ncbi:cyclic nucleotide-binding domain-containing protein [Stieleria sp. TO1_6]|uniref:cyclic nucleotide-binding domain-containing protein n=1 Tax=Stieleria tagensis TaxID=2956795 RepID=UPI00209BA9BA|nr:cyclic nucleotide-binding domain-containing protein [Stieleria tagensis]MCO8120926.1 cyclic nucleotide-binding domain-containing protein [Stieleria tagensis]
MERTDAIPVQRPSRWDEPLDGSMTDADVAWLRTRVPFNGMDRSAFPNATPLDGILRYDCRLHRVEPGEVIVREGDYGNSAFLVITGCVRALVDSLTPTQLGRQPQRAIGWGEALQRFLSRSRFPEARDPDQISVNRAGAPSHSIRQVDDHPAVFLQDFEGIFHRHETVSLGPGELFGEVAAMYRSPRTATVVAETEAALVEIRWQGLRVLRRDRRFADSLEQHYRQHWLPVHLREIPLLRYLPESNLQRVIESTELRSYGRMEWNASYKKTRKLPAAEQIQAEPLVVEEDQLPTELIILRSGFGRLSVRHGAAHRTTAYLGKGHLFGLEEIVHNATRPDTSPPIHYQNSLRAVGFLDALAIPVEVFATEILPHIRKSELPATVNLSQLPTTGSSGERRRRRSERRSEQVSDSIESPPVDVRRSGGDRFESTGLLEFIVQNRLNNGQDAMVIDLHRCTRCDDCVKACGDVHEGNPRFVRQGAIHDRLQFVQACMHCSDPVCMIGCPTGAIARDTTNGVVSIHDSICVGCGVCAASCPYDTIRMTDVVDRKGRPFIDDGNGKPIRKATKCDQCSGLPSGPACVAACPHDALVRIDLSESPPLTNWLQKRS